MVMFFLKSRKVSYNSSEFCLFRVLVAALTREIIRHSKNILHRLGLLKHIFRIWFIKHGWSSVAFALLNFALGKYKFFAKEIGWFKLLTLCRTSKSLIMNGSSVLLGMSVLLLNLYLIGSVSFPPHSYCAKWQKTSNSISLLRLLWNSDRVEVLELHKTSSLLFPTFLFIFLRKMLSLLKKQTLIYPDTPVLGCVDLFAALTKPLSRTF